MADFSQFPDGITVVDNSEFVGYNPPAGTGVPYLRWTGLEIYTYINGKLGLGGAAFLNVGTIAGTVAAGNDSRITGAVQATNNGSDFASASTTINNLLPSQTGANGKVLESNGTAASWQTVASATGPVQTGNSSVTISSLQSDPDADLGTGSNDDFIQNTSGVPSGWSAVTGGTPDTIDTNTAYSLLHMVALGGGGTNNLKGIIKNVPSFPFTVTCKMRGWTPGGMGSSTGYAQNACGLFLSVAGGAGANLAFQGFFNSSYNFDLAVRLASSRTNVTNNIYDAGSHYAGRPPIYLRFVVASNTTLTAWMSYDGFDFTQVPLSSSLNAYTPGFTIATVGLFVDGSSGATGTTAHFDWIRFT